MEKLDQAQSDIFSSVREDPNGQGSPSADNTNHNANMTSIDRTDSLIGMDNSTTYQNPPIATHINDSLSSLSPKIPIVEQQSNMVNTADENLVPVYHVSPVYKTSYANVAVLEMEVNGCQILRRLKDSYFNVTQILKLSGLDKSKQKKILEDEIYQNLHEKVQSGPDPYQGIWIPYERTADFCRECDLYDILKPLLLYNRTTDELTTPTKEHLIKQNDIITTINNDNDNDSNDVNVDTDKSKGQKKPLDSPTESPSKRIKFTHDDLPPLELFDYDTKTANPNAPFTLKPIPENLCDEKSKVVMSSLFLPYQKDLTLLELVGGDESQLDGVNIDVPIDDNGQTALHLASTLGRISLVCELVERGANRLRGDNDGQTALVRALHATNCFESGCFDTLLDYLYPAITVLDHKGRTILHHIAYTCGRTGRNDASKYYLETLLEWVVKRGPTLPGSSALPLFRFIKDVVNVSDRNGDTCLNIAAMVGNKYITQQLLEVGADPHKANKAGVKPIDCGITIRVGKGEIKMEPSANIHDNNSNSNINNTANNKTSMTPSFNSFKDSNNSLRLLESIQTFVNQLGKNFQDEISHKSSQIEKLHPKLREKTLHLSQKRKQYEELQKLVRQISGYNNKIDNLNKAINEEETRFQQEAKLLPLNPTNFLGNFDADEPFTIWSVYNEVEQRVDEILKTSGSGDVLSVLNDIKPEDILSHLEKKNGESDKNIKDDIPPSVVLEARIKAYKKNNQMLIDRMKARKSSSKELEEQFKRVISLCIGSKPDEIDDKLLSSLLLSVENEPDPEIGQIKKVLKIVNDLDG